MNKKIKKDCNYFLDYKDVFIVPQYSEIKTRKWVETTVRLNDLTLSVPMISANMASVTEEEMCIKMAKGGGIGAMHRFMSIEDNVKKFDKVLKSGHNCFVSVGVNEESKQRVHALYEAGARFFIIDIAHGDHVLMKDMISFIKTQYPLSYVMAGNVATKKGVRHLHEWGADAIKIGIGPGSACLTKNITGVTFPQFSAVMECSKEAKKLGIDIIADGGCSEIGDICKAIGAGATAVMSGKFFANCIEAPGTMDALLKGTKKAYRGSASKEVMGLHRNYNNMPVAEGTTIQMEPMERSVVDVLNDIKSGLQSSMSYSNSFNISDFHNKVNFGIRKTTY